MSKSPRATAAPDQLDRGGDGAALEVEEVPVGPPVVDQSALAMDPGWLRPHPRSLDSVVAAFKKPTSKEVEPVLDSFAALGHLLAFDSLSGRVWKAR